MRHALVGLAFILAAAPEAALGAPCAPRIVSVAVDGSDYDPFAAAEKRVALRVELNNDGEACEAVLSISPGPRVFSLGGPGAGLKAEFDGPGSISGSRFLAPAKVKSGASQVQAQVILAAGQVVPPGDYEALISVRLADELGSDVTADERSALWRVRVAPLAMVGVVSTPSPTRGELPRSGEIDFGSLTTGELGRAYIQIRANSGVRTSLRSLNDGRLKLIGGGESEADYIPYSARFGGRALVLSGPTMVENRPTMSLAGSVYVLEVRIGEVAGRFAGRFHDTIEIEVSAE